MEGLWCYARTGADIRTRNSKGKLRSTFSTLVNYFLLPQINANEIFHAYLISLNWFSAVRLCHFQQSAWSSLRRKPSWGRKTWRPTLWHQNSNECASISLSIIIKKSSIITVRVERTPFYIIIKSVCVWFCRCSLPNNVHTAFLRSVSTLARTGNKSLVES